LTATQLARDVTTVAKGAGVSPTEPEEVPRILLQNGVSHRQKTRIKMKNGVISGIFTTFVKFRVAKFMLSSLISASIVDG
jgi:hypothetical protein